MNAVDTALPVVPVARFEVKASVLAAFQLVEDARYFRSGRATRRARNRLAAERVVAYRKLARDLRAG